MFNGCAPSRAFVFLDAGCSFCAPFGRIHTYTKSLETPFRRSPTQVEFLLLQLICKWEGRHNCLQPPPTLCFFSTHYLNLKDGRGFQNFDFQSTSDQMFSQCPLIVGHTVASIFGRFDRPYHKCSFVDCATAGSTTSLLLLQFECATSEVEPPIGRD